ncbi:MAG: alpha/beta fold hydrolase [Casimicrobiaceae bacterium]
MPDTVLQSIELETGPKPTGSVVWLHGLGADGNDFVPVVPELKLPPTLPLRFVFPHAPTRRVTINNGMPMRAWYDIAGADFNNRADIAGVQQSQKQIEQLIAREVERGIAAARIVLAGFSQGGAIALYAGVRYRERLAGILALSTYLVAADKLAIEAASVNRDVPIFMAHGTADPMIRLAWAEASRKALETGGYRVVWHTYQMEHSVCLEEIQAISAWLQKVLAS